MVLYLRSFVYTWAERETHFRAMSGSFFCILLFISVHKRREVLQAEVKHTLVEHAVYYYKEKNRRLQSVKHPIVMGGTADCNVRGL